jgi:methylphosphotriester-DNA--protein-cysteine methyltransferase
MTAQNTPLLPAFDDNRRPVLLMEPGLVPLFRHVDGPFRMMGHVGWGELHDALRRSPPSTMVVVDPYAGARLGERFPRLRELLRRFPSVPVVVAMELRRELAPEVNMLVEWGVSEVVPLGREVTPLALGRRLEQAHARPLKRAVETTLSPLVRSDARQILMAAAEVAADGGQAPELGTRLRVSPRTLTERCTNAELPPPRTVQAWMRVLLACMLLDDPGRTVYGAAYASGYQSDRSLRRSITALLGVDSTTLRRAGAFKTAVKAFNVMLREARDAAWAAARQADRDEQQRRAARE